MTCWTTRSRPRLQSKPLVARRVDAALTQTLAKSTASSPTPTTLAGDGDKTAAETGTARPCVCSRPAPPAAPKAPEESNDAGAKLIRKIDDDAASLLQRLLPQDRINDPKAQQVAAAEASKQLLASDYVGGLAEKIKAFEKTLNLIYTRYKDNPDKHQFRNKVDRLTLINMMLLFKKDLALGKTLSSLYQMLLDVVKHTDPEAPDPMDFLREVSLTQYFDNPNLPNGGFTGLVNTLRIQASDSLNNTVRFISELRGVKYLMDKVGRAPEAEIIFVNATASEFMDWLNRDNLVQGQGRSRMLSDSLLKGTSDRAIAPALLYMTDLAFAHDRESENAPGSWGGSPDWRMCV